MKRILLLLVVIFASCSQPTQEIIYTQVEYVQHLKGEWLRLDQVVQFYSDGSFRFYDYYTLDDLYNGFYIDYGDTIYLEDYGGATQTYEYFVVYESGNYILRWKTLKSIYWVDYVFIK